MQIPPGPGLGVLRHLRPVDDLAEGGVVVDDESHRGAQPHPPVVRPGHHRSSVSNSRLEVMTKRINILLNTHICA